MSTIRAVADALERAGQLVGRPDTLPTVTGMTDDSRLVRTGTVFCAIEGSVADGHDFATDAANRGAAALVVTRYLDLALPQLLVRDSRIAASIAAAAWYQRPADVLTVVGVTGTNGKSTTVTLIRHLLNAGGFVGALGTLGGMDGRGAALPDDVDLTTPGPFKVQAALAMLLRSGSETVVMEVSSHALDQQRVADVPMCAAVFTNLTRDHLDYHQDEDAYRDAKLRLADLLRDGGVEIVNVDDPAWESLPTRQGVRRVTYGYGAGAVVRADELACSVAGSTFRMSYDGVAVDVRLPLLGAFNVHNALAAAATAWALGSSPDAIATALAEAPQVPGRMERVRGEPFMILRDYAHTPDALARALRALRPLTDGRLIVLFGAGGDRDRGKRSLMGAVAVRDADLAIVTSDNPRTEDPKTIVDEIEAGMGDVSHVRIVDRRDAILHALTLLEPGDCLLLAGKGHETYQIIGTEKLPFDERSIVHEALGGAAA